jgi:hypothetical protein
MCKEWLEQGGFTQSGLLQAPGAAIPLCLGAASGAHLAPMTPFPTPCQGPRHQGGLHNMFGLTAGGERALPFPVFQRCAVAFK